MSGRWLGDLFAFNRRVRRACGHVTRLQIRRQALQYAPLACWLRREQTSRCASCRRAGEDVR